MHPHLQSKDLAVPYETDPLNKALLSTLTPEKNLIIWQLATEQLQSSNYFKTLNYICRDILPQHLNQPTLVMFSAFGNPSALLILSENHSKDWAGNTLNAINPRGNFFSQILFINEGKRSLHFKYPVVLFSH